MNKIPYTQPIFKENEYDAINELLTHPDAFLTEKYSKECRGFLENYYKTTVLLTHSCTAALEMSALLLNIKPGDEVIIPSFTFVSTANAFTLFGATPVFIDSTPDTLNIDPQQIEAAITPKTRAIVAVHYAGVACDMEKITAIANKHHLPLIEDAAQCLGASYQGKNLGTFGSMGALSFHHTKNITSGLGGALILNDETLMQRAKIIWQKGTDREAFLEGYIDKYTWQDLGSSYMMNEIGAALLKGQLERLSDITSQRLSVWNTYHEGLASLENKGFKRPTIPQHCHHNGHIYYLMAPTEQMGHALRQNLAKQNISAPFHYVPLHLSPAGQRFSKNTRALPICEGVYKRIVRLPIWEGMAMETEKIINIVLSVVNDLAAISEEMDSFS